MSKAPDASTVTLGDVRFDPVAINDFRLSGTIAGDRGFPESNLLEQADDAWGDSQED